VPRGQRDGSLRPYFRPSRLEPLFSLSSSFLNCTHEAEWTSFLTHYLSENLVAPGIESGPLDLSRRINVPKSSGTMTSLWNDDVARDGNL
jgi:hypothetical protein